MDHTPHGSHGLTTCNFTLDRYAQVNTHIKLNLFLILNQLETYNSTPHADNMHDVKYYSDVDDSYVVDRPDVGDVAKLQWKAMVDDLSNKGKWKNCLAVCEFFTDPSDVSEAGVPEAMGLLVSQLNDKEPWKGKVIPFTRNPKRLHLIQGDDLKSKLACFRGTGISGNSATTQKVLDLILQEAMNANLKPEQMIKRVLVFFRMDFDMSSIQAEHWPITYQIMRSKFEEKGYAVPHIVFWYMYSRDSDMVVSSQVSGMTTFTGYTDDFFKLFLDREGDVSPNHAMEAAICGKEYQNLVVVD
ncbi:hypothetical protein ACFX1R_041331 [Malus domestica]